MAVVSTKLQVDLRKGLSEAELRRVVSAATLGNVTQIYLEALGTEGDMRNELLKDPARLDCVRLAPVTPDAGRQQRRRQQQHLRNLGEGDAATAGAAGAAAAAAEQQQQYALHFRVWMIVVQLDAKEVQAAMAALAAPSPTRNGRSALRDYFDQQLEELPMSDATTIIAVEEAPEIKNGLPAAKAGDDGDAGGNNDDEMTSTYIAGAVIIGVVAFVLYFLYRKRCCSCCRRGNSQAKFGNIASSYEMTDSGFGKM